MLQSTVKGERRKKLRKRPLRLIYVELAFGNGGMMRDLSEEGFAVRAMMPLRQNDKTTFSFTLGDTVRIEGEGKILWIDEGGRVAGVEFLQIPAEMKAKIDDWLLEDEKVENPREKPPEPAIAPASTMDQLREELRSTPVRTEAEPATEVALEPVAIAPPAPTAEPSQTQPQPSVQLPAMPTAPPAAPPLHPTEILSPRPAPPSSLNDGTSVTEGFFRKWPRTAPPESAVPERHAEDLLRHRKDIESTLPTDEPPEEEPIPSKAEPLLPDISEVLIQPHGLSDSSARQAATHGSARSPDAAVPRSSHGEWFTLPRAVLSMVALMLLVGLLVFHKAVGNSLILLGEAMGGTSQKGAPPAVGAENSDDRGSNSNPSRPSANTDAARSTPSTLSGAPKSAPASVTPLSVITQTQPNGAEVSPDSGQAEYLQAIQILRGRNTAAEMPEAVRLLWTAVEKGNPSAEVALADLYWRGQGVVKNCDQTRILLTAAVRKGNGEAQRRLQQFQREGCE